MFYANYISIFKNNILDKGGQRNALQGGII